MTANLFPKIPNVQLQHTFMEAESQFQAQTTKYDKKATNCKYSYFLQGHQVFRGSEQLGSKGNRPTIRIDRRDFEILYQLRGSEEVHVSNIAIPFANTGIRVLGILWKHCGENGNEIIKLTNPQWSYFKQVPVKAGEATLLWDSKETDYNLRIPFLYIAEDNNGKEPSTTKY